MKVLQIVPPKFFQELRWQAVYSQGRLQPLTIQGLASRILKERGVVYREDWVLETVAVWEAVEQLLPDLEYFAPIAHYPGFVDEVRWLLHQVDYGELKLDELPSAARPEVEKLHRAYHARLEAYGVLDGPGQLRRALISLQDTPPAFLQGFQQVELVGLPELTPLEGEFIRELTRGRVLRLAQPEPGEGEPSITAALDPAAEIEEIAKAVRRQLEDGLSPRQIGVAFPEPRNYASLLLPIFGKYGIPWNMPGQSLADLPLGRAVSAFLTGEIAGWHKSHLQLLTAPGWGLPFSLTEEERRALRLAPPLEGLPAWMEYLGSFPGWEGALTLVRQVSQGFPAQPLAAHARSLQKLLGHFPPERWQVGGLLAKAELLKSWDALQLILDDLKLAETVVSLERFALLVRSIMQNYGVNPPRTLADRIAVLPISELGAARLKALHVGGLVQGDFPRNSRRHWLTRLKASEDAHAMYKLILSAGEDVFLYYPQTDHEGKLNLPSTVIPRVDEERRASGGDRLPIWRPQPEFTSLADPKVVEEIRARILAEGLSVSQLNRYARCPYHFFCAFVLKLDPLEEESLEPTALDEGRIVHSVLQKFWENHSEGPLPTISQGQGEVEGLLQEHYAELGMPAPPRLLRMLRRFIRYDLGLASQGWRPTFLERRFRGLMIPVVLADGSEYQVELRGVIDRIDLAPDGSYVLYDYKTGSAPTATEVRLGKDVQIAAYLLAAQELLPAAENVGVGYYLTTTAKRVGIFQEDWTEPLLLRRGDNCLAKEDFLAQLGFFQETISSLLGGIFAGKFPAEPSSSQVCSYCPYQGISRREVGIG